MLDIEINEKIYKNLFIFVIILIIAFILLNLISLSIPRVYVMDKNVQISSSEEIASNVDMIYRGKTRLEISGWTYKKGESIQNFESYFILKNQETGKMYLLKTEMKEVEALSNVDEQFNCKNSGMYTQSIVLGIKKGMYDLCILYKNNGENMLVNTGFVVEI